ncbi:hypothetical protein [Mucilaginibacter glaciei]|uniref:Uncharacterized protein n=1 Tax=Mucilaginibacter glaciei TaxID=2772109 RepID=A0A926NTF6_9SPHI|nr:hypothetical protein [Mucilaginibacter glaciei]MBD1394282.1 hypothetical protein [Mucilaginibacter glaciei]
MVISFNKKFVEPILTGSKIHTIREDAKGRWRPGITMHMYTGGRFSKEYRQFIEMDCRSVQDVYMTYYNGKLEVSVDDTLIYGYPERNEFAISDGFADWEDFEKWWIPILMNDPELKYKGRVIHWTNIKY